MVATVRAATPKVFGSIKIVVIEMFDDRYATIIKVADVAATVVVATMRPHGEDAMQYLEFNNMKPLEFDGVQDPFASMRWITDVEGCFYICSCSDDLKVLFVLILLRMGAMDWWKFITTVGSVWVRLTCLRSFEWYHVHS